MNTLRELAAIRSTAEDAAARILDSAEGLLALADTEEEAQKAQDAILSIMTACGFHDLVGQRVTKITKTLDHVIATRLNSGASRIDVPAARTSQVELDGPGHPGSGADQARIDALFGEKN
jgi:chemotaxis regulatin CheY-phosphate phosphatase CheZ